MGILTFRDLLSAAGFGPRLAGAHTHDQVVPAERRIEVLIGACVARVELGIDTHVEDAHAWHESSQGGDARALLGIIKICVEDDDIRPPLS
jgi:hypothetical protein